MDQFIRNPRNQVILILILLTFSAGYLWWSLRYDVRQKEIGLLSQRDAKLTAMNSSARKAIGTIGVERVRQALEAYDRQEASVRHLLPPDTSVHSLLPLIAEKARMYEVTMSKLTPEERQTDSLYSVDRYLLTLTGSYHDIGGFLTEMSSLRQIIHVRQMKAESQTQAQAADHESTAERVVKADVVLEAYSRPVKPGEELGGNGSVVSAPIPSSPAAGQAQGAAPAGITPVRYERDSKGKLWQYLAVPGKSEPIRIPVPENGRAAAEAALASQPN